MIAGLSPLAVTPAHSQSITYDCQATLQSLAASNPGLHCTCACATCRASCSQGGSGGSSKQNSSASMKAAIQQQVAATLIDAFVNMLFSTDSKAAAQKQQMMEELARRKAEAERKHNIEEALRLEAITNRLVATLKLNGLPGLKLKDEGSSAGALQLKMGDGGDEHIGIKGLPGIALNDNTGNGGSTPYGVSGLPGIYTNGPGSGTARTHQSEPGLRLKMGEDSAPAVQFAVNPPLSPDVPAGVDAPPPSLADGARDPQDLTAQQLADAATLMSNLPPEEQQRLMNAAAAHAQASKSAATVHTTADSPNSATGSQLQLAVNASQSAALATGPEDAAAKARLGFDQANGGLPKPSVATGAGVPVVSSPQAQTASTSSMSAGAAPSDQPPVVSAISPYGNAPTSNGPRVDLSVLGAGPVDRGEPIGDAKHADWRPCDDPTIQMATLTTEQRAFLQKQLQDANDRQAYINTALKNLIKLNSSQQKAVNEMTDDISERYTESVDRAFDVVSDLLTSLPVGQFTTNYDLARTKIEHAITAKIGLKRTALEAGNLQKVDEEIEVLEAQKSQLEAAYKRSFKLLDGFQAANNIKDTEDWDRTTKKEADRGKKGLMLVGNLALDHPLAEEVYKKLMKALPSLDKNVLGVEKFAGANFWEVVAMGRMAYYAAGVADDVLQQMIIWEPLAQSLHQGLETSTHGMDRLRLKSEQTRRDIGCIKTALQ